jgi:hypothetical protein
MDDAVSEPALVEEFELCAELVGQRALAAAHRFEVPGVQSKLPFSSSTYPSSEAIA